MRDPRREPDGREAGPQGRGRSGQSLSEAARSVPASGVHDDLQQPARRGRCRSRTPRSARTSRSSASSATRASAIGSTELIAALPAHPRHRPRLAAGPGRAREPRPGVAQISRVPQPRVPDRRAIRQRPPEDRPDPRRHDRRADRRPRQDRRRAGDRPWRSSASRPRPPSGSADQMVACGIRGILNFAPVPLIVPPTVNVVAVDLSIQLEHLAYKVQNSPGRRSRTPDDRWPGWSSRTLLAIARIRPSSHYPVVKRYHNRFWSCFSRFESWPGSLL